MGKMYLCAKMGRCAISNTFSAAGAKKNGWEDGAAKRIDELRDMRLIFSWKWCIFYIEMRVGMFLA